MNRGHRSDSLYYYKWLDKALCDLQAARTLLTWGNDAANVAFHCQQAMEKALKGYLLFKLGRHVDGHSLTYLCRLAAAADDRFAAYLADSATLNNLYIETRYPTDLPLVLSETQVQRLLLMAENIFAAIREDLYAGGRPHKIHDSARG